MPSVLIVCTANICRSPIGMGLLSQKLKSLPDGDDWRVASAGTWAQQGRRAHENSRAVMAQHGMDIEDHRSQPVTAELLADFDLVLTMEQGHKEALQVEFSQFAKRIRLFSEVAGYQYDIPDPIGYGVGEYVSTYRELDRLLDMGMDRIVKLARGEQAA